MQTSQKPAVHVIRGEAPSSVPPSKRPPRPARPSLPHPRSPPQVWAGFPYVKGLETESCFAECELLTTLRSEGQLSPWVQGTRWAGYSHSQPASGTACCQAVTSAAVLVQGPRRPPNMSRVLRPVTLSSQPRSPAPLRQQGPPRAGLYLINGRFLSVLDRNVF